MSQHNLAPAFDAKRAFRLVWNCIFFPPLLLLLLSLPIGSFDTHQNFAVCSGCWNVVRERAGILQQCWGFVRQRASAGTSRLGSTAETLLGHQNQAWPRGEEVQTSRWGPPPAVRHICRDRIPLCCERRFPLCPGCSRQ